MLEGCDGPDLHIPWPPHDTDDVGLNPFRQHRRSPVDYVLLAAALVAVLALVMWAAGVV